ncbi:hypothetical protein Dimus_004646 [Dionaea muscipula]
MSSSKSGIGTPEIQPLQLNTGPRKPRILLAASGSVAAIKFPNLCRYFSEWGEIKAVVTAASLHFVDIVAIPKDVVLYTDEDDRSSWRSIGDNALHIELSRWADVMVIAPLSANTLGKIAGGLCDNLLTSIVRAWDYTKQLFVAPAMNTLMWKNTFTEKQLVLIDELGVSLIPPVSNRMAEPFYINSTVRRFLELRCSRSEIEPLQLSTRPRKPRILLAASGSVAAIKFANLCHYFSLWGEIKAAVTAASLDFVDRVAMPKDVVIYTDEHDQSSWRKIGDNVLHIELSRWADVMVIAPLSANTLGKIAGGLCDNLLTCIVRAWDYTKPLFVAPAMNTFMWNNPFTESHLMSINELGVSLIPPVSKRLACGDYGKGFMAEPSHINSTIQLFLQSS